MKECIGKVELDYSFYDDRYVYNEGDEVEECILEIVKESTDYDSQLKAMAEDKRWSLLYQLSKQRENIVGPMNITKTDEVLEIGAGMGAVTGALARAAGKVDCIELSKRRSLVNANRNRELDNITIYVGNFQDIKLEKQYDVVTLIGVFEYAQHYIEAENPYEAFLGNIRKYLKPEGKLYIAIENKLGMKYFSGCVEDHLGIPFVGIEGYTKEQNVCTFTKSQLERMLAECGYKDVYFYYPYPDYKLPVEIFSDDYLPTKDSTLSNSKAYDLERLSMFDEEKAFSSIKGSEEIKVLFNSFLIEALKG